MTEFWVAVVLGIIGFFVGGFVGEVQTQAWFLYAWHGLLIGFLVGAGACVCCVADIF